MGISFSPEVLKTFLRKIYKGFDTSKEIEPTMFREILRLLNEATVEGLMQSKYEPTHEDYFLKSLKHSNEVFSAFKAHTMGEKMAARLLDENGKLKPFRQWKEDVRGIASHYVGSWLQTEYNTAVIRAHNAADWQLFERDKDIMPNLRWMPTTSPEPEATHHSFWVRKLTLPVDHPFWNHQHPGNRWNCKCYLEQTDEPANPEVLDEFTPAPPQRGLENNPGKDGHIFNDTHPYFPKSCGKCAFYKNSGLKNRVKAYFSNWQKSCFNCPFIKGCLDAIKEKRKIREERLMLSSPFWDTQLKEKNNLYTGKILISKKTAGRLYEHCHSEEQFDAALYLCEHPEKLRYVRESPFGEGKNLDNPKDKKNLEKKRKRNIVTYRQYEINISNVKWTVKLEEHEMGFEQPYLILQKK